MQHGLIAIAPALIRIWHVFTFLSEQQLWSSDSPTNINKESTKLDQSKLSDKLQRSNIDWIGCKEKKGISDWLIFPQCTYFCIHLEGQKVASIYVRDYEASSSA